MKKFLVASVVAVVVLAVQAKAQTGIVFYSFTSNTTFAVSTASWSNAVTTADVGSSISTFSYLNNGAPFNVLSSVSGNPNNRGFLAGNSVALNGWGLSNASYFQFTLDSTSYQNIILSWGGNVSTTGPTNMTLRYSSTGVGGPFTDFATFATPKNQAVTQDLTSVSALNNNPNVVFRLVGINVGNGTAGSAKIDNFNIDASAIPEPSTVLLVGVGLVGLLALRRRRK